MSSVRTSTSGKDWAGSLHTRRGPPAPAMGWAGMATSCHTEQQDSSQRRHAAQRHRSPLRLAQQGGSVSERTMRGSRTTEHWSGAVAMTFCACWGAAHLHGGQRRRRGRRAARRACAGGRPARLLLLRLFWQRRPEVLQADRAGGGREAAGGRGDLLLALQLVQQPLARAHLPVPPPRLPAQTCACCTQPPYRNDVVMQWCCAHRGADKHLRR